MKKVALGGAVAVMALVAFFSFQGRLFSQAQAQPGGKVAAQDDDNLLFEAQIDMKAQSEETRKLLREGHTVTLTPEQIQVLHEATTIRRCPTGSTQSTGPNRRRCGVQSCHVINCRVVCDPNGCGPVTCTCGG